MRGRPTQGHLTSWRPLTAVRRLPTLRLPAARRLRTVRQLPALRLTTVRQLPTVRWLTALRPPTGRHLPTLRLSTVPWLATLRLPAVWGLPTLWRWSTARLPTVLRLPALRLSAVRQSTVWRPPALRHRRLATLQHPARVLRRHPSRLLMRWLTAARGHRSLRGRATWARTWAAGTSWTTTAVRHSARRGWRESALGRGLLRRRSVLERRRPPIGREGLARAACEAGRSHVVLGASARLAAWFRAGSRRGHAVAAVRRCARRRAVRRDRCRPAR